MIEMLGGEDCCVLSAYDDPRMEQYRPSFLDRRRDVQRIRLDDIHA